jgi:hypothetical protein
LTVSSEPKWTPAPFQPFDRRWLKRFNAIEILSVLVGLAACSTGLIGTIIGVPIILAALYSAIFIPPKVNRGLYIGKCPHCGDAMSATHYQTEVDCPNCGQWSAVKDEKFIALGAPDSHRAA